MEEHKTFELAIKLKGGVGNQLFQIALGLALQEHLQCRLSFDDSSYHTDSFGRKSVLDKFSLNRFGIDLASLNNSDAVYLTENINETITLDQITEFITSKITNSIKIVYMDGYWQNPLFINEKVAASIRSTIIADRDETFDALREKLHIKKNSIAVHVRRTDYEHHGVLNSNYYLNLAQWLKTIIPNPEFFVFTDEPNYTHYFFSNAGIPINIIDTKDDFTNLTLMMSCHAHIIANSTYSWWGAYLSTSRFVVAPESWGKIGPSTTQICPVNWIKAPNSFDSNHVSPDFQEKLNLELLRIEFKQFLSQGSVPKDLQIRFNPQFGDRTSITNYDAHYVYHTSWAARRLFDHKVDLHIDIASDIRFSTIASSFQKIKFLDYRPLRISLANLECDSIDLTHLDLSDDSVQSLSCMHVVEHIGLGRYGDEINYYGADRAMSELQRVVARGGLLYFVTPVGIPALEFNAHRIFSPSEIEKKFNKMKLIEFSFVDDRGIFHENTNIAAAETQRYACGCYIFEKQ